MINKRFQRPINEYTGSEELLYRDKYQQDSNSIPKIAISSAKMDGDFNYVLDAVNTLDEDIKSVVHSGISNQAINGEHIASQAITEQKISNNSVSSRTLQEGAVTNARLSDLAVTTPKLANNSVTKDKMASLSVGTDEVVDKSITRDKLADDAISDSVPVGTIAQYSIDALPTGWILCSGATVSKNTYPQLVRFLTGSDTTLSSNLPNLNIDNSALAKYAIKAFSDTIELANLEIAGLTQDIIKNSSDVNTIKDGFANLLESSGYTKLPNGLILQWGRYGGSAGTVTFPVAFTEGVYSITGSINGINPVTGNDSDSGFNARGVSLTSFYGEIGRVFQNTPWTWMAIGK